MVNWEYRDERHKRLYFDVHDEFDVHERPSELYEVAALLCVYYCARRSKQMHQRETRKAHQVAPSPGTVVRKAIAHGMEARRHSLAGVEETDDEWDE